MLIHKCPRYERMRCTRIKKNKCGYRIDNELTNHSIRLIIDLLHINMVHMPLERIGLADSRIPIVVLVLRAHVGVVSHLPALETLNSTKVLLSIHHLTVLVVVLSISNSFPIAIAIAILVAIVVVVAIMVVTIPTMMVVSSTVNMAISTIVVVSMAMSSIATISIAWLLLRSRVVLATIVVVVVLPVAILNGLLLAFQHNSFVYERLAVSKSSHCQPDSQLIIQPFQELLLPCSIIPDIIWSISGKLVEHLNILGHCTASLTQTAELLLLHAHGAC